VLSKNRISIMAFICRHCYRDTVSHMDSGNGQHRNQDEREVE
jgi:hypothetical protein